MHYCNSLLAGTDIQIKLLKSVQNLTARLVPGTRRRDHITSIQDAVLVWKCIASAYLRELSAPGRKYIEVVVSYGQHQHQLPRTHTSVGQRSFAFCVATVCHLQPLCDNTVSLHVHAADKHIFLNDDAHHPAPLRRCGVSAMLAPCTNVMTYLLRGTKHSIATNYTQLGPEVLLSSSLPKIK